MHTGLEEKHIVITASTNGIGYAAAKMFIEEGACVVINGRNEDVLKERCRLLEKEYGDGCVLGFCGDVTKQSDIAALKKYVNDMFCNGWTASKNDDSITFEIMGTEIAIQYRKSVNHPAPVAVAVVDGDEEHAVRLDANFDETWGDCLYIDTVAHHIAQGVHKVEVRLTETHENDVVPFYLVSVIGSY